MADIFFDMFYPPEAHGPQGNVYLMPKVRPAHVAEKALFLKSRGWILQVDGRKMSAAQTLIILAGYGLDDGNGVVVRRTCPCTSDAMDKAIDEVIYEAYAIEGQRETWAMQVEDVQVFDRVLSAKEIQLMYDLRLESTSVDDLK